MLYRQRSELISAVKKMQARENREREQKNNFHASNRTSEDVSAARPDAESGWNEPCLMARNVITTDQARAIRGAVFGFYGEQVTTWKRTD
jgi:hypothetical protein